MSLLGWECRTTREFRADIFIITSPAFTQCLLILETTFMKTGSLVSWNNLWGRKGGGFYHLRYIWKPMRIRDVTQHLIWVSEEGIGVPIAYLEGLLSLKVMDICTIIWTTHLLSHCNAGPKSWGDITTSIRVFLWDQWPWDSACDLQSQFLNLTSSKAIKNIFYPRIDVEFPSLYPIKK